MIRLLLRLALLVLTADRALAYTPRNITQHSPTDANQPLLQWPALSIEPYRDKLRCVAQNPDDPNNADPWRIQFYHNEVQIHTHVYGTGKAQMNQTDPFYRLGTNPAFRTYRGTWACQWLTKVYFQNRLQTYFGSRSPNFTIYGADEKPLDCGVPWEDFPSNIPMNYNAPPGKRKRQANPQKSIKEPDFRRMKSNKRGISGGKTDNNSFENMDEKVPNLGKLRNAVVVPIKSMPWIVSIRYWQVKANGNTKSFTCTGAFLSSIWVITAAHCFPEAPTTPRPNTCFVYAGTNERLQDPARKCRRIFKHPGAYRDVAMVQLYGLNDPDISPGINDRFRFVTLGNPHGNPGSIWGSSICLPDADRLDAFDRKECYIAGFGFGTEYHRPLRAIKVKIETLVAMWMVWAIGPDWARRTPWTIFNFLNIDVWVSGALADIGDSGSPIVCKLHGTQHWQLAGIATTTGTLCPGNRWCRNYISGQRASTLKDWILAYLNRTAYNIDTLVTPQAVHRCGPHDVKCGEVHCVPNYWFQPANLARTQNMQVSVYNWLVACKRRLGIARKAHKSIPHSAGYKVTEIDSSASITHRRGFLNTSGLFVMCQVMLSYLLLLV